MSPIRRKRSVPKRSQIHLPVLWVTSLLICVFVCIYSRNTEYDEGLTVWWVSALCIQVTVLGLEVLHCVLTWERDVELQVVGVSLGVLWMYGHVAVYFSRKWGSEMWVAVLGIEMVVDGVVVMWGIGLYAVACILREEK